jgi:hypothetical protein
MDDTERITTAPQRLRKSLAGAGRASALTGAAAGRYPRHADELVCIRSAAAVFAAFYWRTRAIGLSGIMPVGPGASVNKPRNVLLTCSQLVRLQQTARSQRHRYRSNTCTSRSRQAWRAMCPTGGIRTFGGCPAAQFTAPAIAGAQRGPGLSLRARLAARR